MIKNNFKIVDDIVYLEIIWKDKNYICVFDKEDINKIAEVNVKWFVKIRNNRIECVVGTKGGGGNKKSIYFHRVIMDNPDGLLIDHIDRNPLNNRKENLRICTKEENNQNKGKTKFVKGMETSSKYKGVFNNKGKYKLYFKKTETRMTFSNEIAAANYYNHLAVSEYGEFASLNDVEFMSIDDCEKFRITSYKKSNKPSKYKGVWWNPSSNKWVARYYDKQTKKKVYLGSFETEDLAFESIKNYIELGREKVNV